VSPQDKATTERHARTLGELVNRPENMVCVHCKHNGTSIFSLFSCSLHPDFRSPLGLFEYVCFSSILFPPRLIFALEMSFCVFAALVFTVEWALGSAKSSRSISTHRHLSRWRHVVSSLFLPSSLMNLQHRTCNNGAIVLITYTGKHISNRAMFS
jgi:hypothetical protein